MKTKIYHLVLIFGFFLNSNAQIPTDGLVGYWPFNLNANDASGSGNIGINHGATLTTDRFGIANSAYYFNGLNNFIKVSNADSLNNKNFTYSLWLKLDTIPANGNAINFMELGSQGYAGGHYGQLFSINNDYVSTTGWRVTSGNTNYSMIGFQNDTLPDTKIWYHWVVVRNDSIIRLYINNNNIISKITNGLNPYYNNPLDLYFGCRADTNLNQYFKGKIDDIRIYNRSLSSAEISSLYMETIHYSDSVKYYNRGFEAGVKSVDTLKLDSVKYYNQGFKAGVNSVDTVKYYNHGFKAGVNSVDTLEIFNHGMESCSKTEVRTLVNDNKISVYPNPTKGLIYLQGDNITKTVIIDINGKTLGTKFGQSLNLSDLDKGTYFLKIYDSSGSNEQIVQVQLIK